MKTALVIASSVITLVVGSVYAQDVQKGTTFTDGQTVHAADLNNLVDSAIILPTFISGKGTATPLTTDFLLYLQNSTSSIKKVTLGDALVAGSVVNTTTTQTANTILAGPTGGAAAAPSFRLLKPADTAVATQALSSGALDASLSNTFYRQLTGNTAFTISNMPNGAVITVAIRQAGAGGPYNATFPGVFWKGGTAPVLTATPSKIDLFTFISIGGVGVLGSVSQNY